jgi:hypothetical protein
VPSWRGVRGVLEEEAGFDLRENQAKDVNKILCKVTGRCFKVIWYRFLGVHRHGFLLSSSIYIVVDIADIFEFEARSEYWRKNYF